MMKPQRWTAGYVCLVVIALVIIGVWVVTVDPYFHFHKPDTARFFYSLYDENQRYQNDGIIKNFDYEGLITGTSMTENFKTSEAERLWGGDFVKVPFSGAPYREINDNLEVALSSNQNLKTIIRGLDMGMFLQDKDYMRYETYPAFLYDNNIFNDVEYVYNRHVVVRVCSMTIPFIRGEAGGITSFDKYSNWMEDYTFGNSVVLPNDIKRGKFADTAELTQEEVDMISGNIRQNVTALADEYPDVTFYYFFTPYSAAWWQSKLIDGTIGKQIEEEKIVIEEILKHDNIRLYSFNHLTDIVTDLNNYKDIWHYGEWVNSLMLRYMHDGKCLLTLENYEQYLEDEMLFYSIYDYTRLNRQEDYENDYYASALLNEKISNVRPFRIDLKNNDRSEVEVKTSVGDCLKDAGYEGFRYNIEDISAYKYLVFYARKIADQGQLKVYIYNAEGNAVAECVVSHQDLDREWHQYLIDVSEKEGKVTLFFDGGCIEDTGNADSLYVFRDLTLY